MKHLFLEDRDEMTWLRVGRVMCNGEPRFGCECSGFDNEAAERFIRWCNEHGVNWMVSEVVRGDVVGGFDRESYPS